MANTANLQRLTVKQAARVMNVSERSVYMAGELMRTGRHDLVAAVEAGTLKLHAALKAARPARQPRSKAVDKLRAAWVRASPEDRAAFLAWTAEHG